MIGGPHYRQLPLSAASTTATWLTGVEDDREVLVAAQSHRAKVLRVLVVLWAQERGKDGTESGR
jgi:hypothetical protein